MITGGVFLADEISLADDSVLERINSVLEKERSLLIAEKGDEVPELIRAHHDFVFVGTMNPGGDYGKKEVRNRNLSNAIKNYGALWKVVIKRCLFLSFTAVACIAKPADRDLVPGIF